MSFNIRDVEFYGYVGRIRKAQYMSTKKNLLYEKSFNLLCFTLKSLSFESINSIFQIQKQESAGQTCGNLNKPKFEKKFNICLGSILSVLKRRILGNITMEALRSTHSSRFCSCLYYFFFIFFVKPKYVVKGPLIEACKSFYFAFEWWFIFIKPKLSSAKRCKCKYSRNNFQFTS